MKNKQGLASSIVISVFVTIILFLIIFLAFSSFKEAMNEFVESGQEATKGDAGASFAMVFAAMFAGLALILMFFIPMAFILVTSIILLPISIRNRKVETKWIRILSYVFDGFLGFSILFVIAKFILIRVGLG